jgi:chromatin structure-remodeling complex protein RSC7
LTDNEDEDMQDAPQDVATPREDSQDIKDEIEDEEGDRDNDDEDGTPARDSVSRSGTPRRSGRGTSLIPRKRRLGRPPKNKIHSDDEDQKSGSDVATPVKRGRGGFRGHRGGRWGKPRGGPSHVSQAPKDQEGNELEVLNDEVVLPEDAEGERKIDKLGYLQHGREYRVRTFTIFGRGKRLYMLSTEPARCIGFRDSYLFFQKHKLLYKIIIDDDEKRDLIERDLIPHSYKGRAIGVVTARSVFREFGSKIIIGGKKIVDDYHVQRMRAAGEIEGELAAPDDVIPPPGQAYNRNQYVAWHGASSVYHTGNPTVPLPGGKMVDGKKRKIAVTSDNWMLEHAREARYDVTLSKTRFPSDTSQSLQQCARWYSQRDSSWPLRHPHQHHAISQHSPTHTRSMGTRRYGNRPESHHKRHERSHNPQQRANGTPETRICVRSQFSHPRPLSRIGARLYAWSSGTGRRSDEPDECIKRCAG